MNQNLIARATIGRLPLYLKYLKSLPDSEQTISATKIARALGLGEVQVRKDLSSVCGTGRPKIGYYVTELTAKIESSIGYKSRSRAVIVGTGKLGKALLSYTGFENYGLEIACGFDSDEQKINDKTKSNILHVSKLKEYCQRENIKIGIIAVPVAFAQTVADELVDAGIEAIWNFAPCALNLPDNVIVKREDIALSLAYLDEQLRKKNQK